MVAQYSLRRVWTSTQGFHGRISIPRHVTCPVCSWHHQDKPNSLAERGSPGLLLNDQCANSDLRAWHPHMWCICKHKHRHNRHTCFPASLVKFPFYSHEENKLVCFSNFCLHVFLSRSYVKASWGNVNTIRGNWNNLAGLPKTNPSSTPPLVCKRPH